MTSRFGLKTRRHIALSALVGIAVFATWLLVPPYETPDVLCKLTYAQLGERLGPPTEIVDEKYIAWVSGRVIGFWMIEAPYKSAPSVNEKPRAIERRFMLGVKGYSYTVLSVTAEQSGAASAH
jgi:hypothetical protein